MNTPAKEACRRPLKQLALAAALAGALAAGVTALPANAAPSLSPDTPASLTKQRLQREVEKTLEEAGYVSVSVQVREGRHRVHATAGEAELGSGRPVARNSDFRAASVTKTFVATVVLQLVAEGRLSLGDTVEKWLPGVVTGNGNDGSHITIRNLLQHTSGIYNYNVIEDFGETAADFERHRFDHVSPEQNIAGAMKHKPDFPPADANDPKPDWNYSNPGYILAGMVIEKATGRTWAQEVHDRIVRPLGLKSTYEPGDDPYLKEPYAHTYQRFPGSTGWTDTSVRNMSWGDAAGSLISSERDLDRFYTALLTGRLLPAAQLAEMRRTVVPNEDILQVMPGLRYGLGLMRQPLSCGGYRWGHGGDLDGHTVRTGFTADGRRSVVISASGKTADDEQLFRAELTVQRLTDVALCGTGTDTAKGIGTKGTPR
ncbi:serine hydrolase domain-containing protein [Streptomyces sp. NPDC050704]|uniref:serine hydrolase domain-containing protein n=1 Tax=Streptomyces sp. NPDC050704 TaxID=3157219 RepID=UPI00341638D3